MDSQSLLITDATTASIKQFLQSPTHAVLLAGNSGLGKTIIAKNLATKLLGLDDDKLANYPYVSVLEPKKGIIAIEKVREIQDFVVKKVPGSKKIRRVLLIFDIDTMTIPAQNAFLKILEEPPADTVIVSTTSKLHSLLSTIRSRMATIKIATPSTTEVKDFFVAKDISENDVKRAQVLYGSDISKIHASFLPDNQDAEKLALAKKFLQGSVFERLVMIQEVSKDREIAKELCVSVASLSEAALNNTHENNAIARWHAILKLTNQSIGQLNNMANTKLVMSELATNI